jgi:hypothetical protein
MGTFITWIRTLHARPARRTRGRAAPPRPEALEDRCLLSSYYSIDGSGNNLSDPSRYYWGSVGQDLLRVAPAQYGDGISSMAGADRPSARLVSTTVATDPTDGNLPNNRFMSDWVYAWGQFIDHDIDLTTNGTGTQLDPANIPVPAGDPYFDPNNTGTQVIDFNRSEYDSNTGTSTSNPRQQPNNITAFIDGSMIYGSDPVRASDLRAGYGGRLLTRGDQTLVASDYNLMPYNTFGLPNANDAHLVPDDQLFLAGDVRANENIELTAVHTLFLREHNRIAGIIAASDFAGQDLTNPAIDEQIYQQTRAIVIGEVQSITYNEFLPALLGTGVIPAYSGYNPTINPDIATEFSTAGYRMGHSLLAPDVQFLNPDATTQNPPVSLANSFFNPPTFLANGGADPILKYLSTDNAQEIDNKLVPELQNFLFGPPGSGGFDLASLNIQRGRDHGLADYNTTRAAYGLPRVKNFGQITSNQDLQEKLKSLYGSVDNIDLWVGALAEDHVAGGSVGPLVQKIVATQFENLRDGDRLWFENLYAGDPTALSAFENVTLAQVIDKNTVNSDLQSDVFFFKMQITGRVFNDANGNGVQDAGEGGLGGRTVQVLDATTGAVVASTKTANDGTYSFDNLANALQPGVAYKVVETPNNGQHLTTTFTSPTLTFTRGATFSHVDFGNASGKDGQTLVPISFVETSGTTAGSFDAALAGIVTYLTSRQ